jgi:hypothetical protein
MLFNWCHGVVAAKELIYLYSLLDAAFFNDEL